MQTYKVLENKHIGENAFVLGAGTSLYGLDLRYIHDYVVLSVNSSILLMPWDVGSNDKRYWISNDSLVRRWSYWERVKQAHAVKLVRNSWEKYYDEIPDFLYFWRRHTPENLIDPDDDGLCYCSSVPTSIDLAIYMGCKNIFILGVDQYSKSGKRYFWQLDDKIENPFMIFKNKISEKGWLPNLRQQQWTYGYDKQAYEALEKYSKIKDVKIYNCNMMSRVNAFEKIKFDMVKDII